MHRNSRKPSICTRPSWPKRKRSVGYDTEKALANVVLLSEIPTTYDKDQKRQVNAGNLLLRGVPGVGKTFSASSSRRSATHRSRVCRAERICSPLKSWASR
jgi:hypothetical protein